jgi:hypothetical protein
LTIMRYIQSTLLAAMLAWLASDGMWSYLFLMTATT